MFKELVYYQGSSFQNSYLYDNSLALSFNVKDSTIIHHMVCQNAYLF